ncbi:MAG: hypothetical protein QOD06_247 [Candidatus Binatota bacterium]|nr:hypothetical protein [Candidatus Binatota bacterium]
MLRIAILAGWAAMMLALHQRVGVAAVPAPIEGRWLDEIAVSSPFTPGEGEAEEWYGVYREDRKVGAAHHRRARRPEGFHIEDQAVLKLTMMGAPRLVRTHLAAETDARLALRRFDFHLRSASVDVTLAGEVDASGVDVTMRAAGSERKFRIPLRAPPVLPQTLPSMLAREELETGKTFHYPLFDPITAESTDAVLRVGAIERLTIDGTRRSAFLVTQEFRGATSRLWVEPGGRVLKEEGPLGLTMIRESRVRAVAPLDSGGLDVTSTAAIPVKRAIRDARDLARLELAVAGVPPGRGLSFPPRQVELGDRLTIRREDLASAASYPLPADAKRFAADLAPTPFLQSDDPKIQALAREITGGDRDARRAAGKLMSWVFENLKKVPTVSIPSALEVLETRRGDCNEHAVLFAALARAAGLPARVIAGTVYMPGIADDPGAFYYHAWVEVWLGEWIAADPTFGQLPADATHVKLLEGGPEHHADLGSWIGRLQFEVRDSG